MPSSWSFSCRFELQFDGENTNTWGDKLNTVLTHADFAIAGWLTKALTGNYALTTANAADDEARAAMVKFTGVGPFTVTIPSVSKAYDVWNACAAALTITTGAGATAVLQPGESCRVMCNGADVLRVQGTNFGGSTLTGVGSPVNATDGVNKAYADALAFIANSGVLPGQTGANGFALFSNGTNALWRQIAVADVANLVPTINASAISFALAFGGS